VFLELEKGAKPSTLIDYEWMLAEPGQPHRRGTGRSPGLLMGTLGDHPIAAMTTREVATFLRSLDEGGAKPRTINRYRQLVSAAFDYAMREDTYGLATNPAVATSKRREPPPAVLDFYEPDEVELLAQAAGRGAHRTVGAAAIGDEELAARRREDHQDAELYRMAGRRRPRGGTRPVRARECPSG
jgi:integrase